MGGKHIDAKPLRNIGAGVLEVVSDHRGDTFRTVYTVKLEKAVYVLHAFQKKSKHGIATPKRVMELVKQAAGACHRDRPGTGEIAMPKRTKDYVVSSGNVFADLGLPNAEEALAKAKLAHKITEIVSTRKLAQVQTATLLGVDQPKVSALMRGRLSGFSLERLMRFLLLLGQDIQITVQACPRSRPQARVRVA